MNEQPSPFSRRTQWLFLVWSVMVFVPVPVFTVATWLEWPLRFFDDGVVGMAVVSVAAVVLFGLLMLSCAQDMSRRKAWSGPEAARCLCDAVLVPEDTSCSACGFDWNNAEIDDEPARPRYAPGCCQRCGYDIAGLTEPKCPECGGVVVGVRDLTPEWRAEWQIIRKGVVCLSIGSTLTLAGGAVLIRLMPFLAAVPVLSVLHGAVMWAVCGLLFWSKAGREIGRGENIPPTDLAGFGLALAWISWLFLAFRMFGLARGV